MEKLKKLTEHYQTKTRPSDSESIQKLEDELGIVLSPEYRSFLSTFGVIIYKENETFGLGVPEDYYLNVLSCYIDLSRDPTYPVGALPLLAIGDGRYYLYDNRSKKILLWATPNGGVVRVLDEGLEQFLIDRFFGT